MAKRRKWNPRVIVNFEEVTDLNFAKVLAELGELVYKEIRSRQLKSENKPSIAARSAESNLNSDRKVAHG